MEDIMEKTILIADDAEINRDMLKFIFEEQFEILEAEDGQEAIEIISPCCSLIFSCRGKLGWK